MVSATSSRSGSRSGSTTGLSRSSSAEELRDKYTQSDPLPQGKKKSSNAFKLFIRKSSLHRRASFQADPLDGSRTYLHFERMLKMDELLGIVQPCPFLKPLEYKLEARQEKSYLPRPSSDAGSMIGISPITIARKRGETNRILIGRASKENLAKITEEDIQSNEFFEGLAISSERRITRNFEQYEQVARKLAPDASSVSMWSYYVHCYAKGQFNILEPPDPPMQGSNFKYFPAVLPPNEATRVTLSTEYDILWPNWTQEKSGALLRAAMSKFETPYASLSIFDDKSELFRAENGYNQPEISRDVSIAAHALYTHEVLVLLDAKNDWRFAGNPLVKGEPKIRFFAGAPLLSADGLALGVFAIWAKEPRVTFSPDERRELAEFSALVMTDLTLQGAKLSDPDLRSTPILQRDSIINGTFRSYRPESSLADVNTGANLESELVPPALRYHRLTTTSKTSPLSINTSSAQQASHSSNYTPPPSRESQDGISYHDGINRVNSDLETECLSPASSYEELTPMATWEGRRVSTPRPFSTSDLTSHYALPPNTPEQSQMDITRPGLNFDETLDRFPTVPDYDYFELSQDFSVSSDIQHSDDFQSLSHRSAETLSTNTGIPTRDTTIDNEVDQSDDYSIYDDPTPVIRDDSREVIEEHGPGSEDGAVELKTITSPQFDPPSPTVTEMARRSLYLHLPFTSPPNETMATADISMLSFLEQEPPQSRVSEAVSSGTSRFWESSEAIKEAAITCSVYAQKLGYDMIYVAEVKPARPLMNDEDLLKPGGLIMKILTAHGLDRPLDLAPATHLEVLRDRGSRSWENTDEHYAEQDFQYGCLVRVQAENAPSQLRSSGIVMGVFRKPHLAARDFDSVYELKRLLDFARVLKKILAKRSRRRKTHRPKTEPPRTSNESYPANEAIEVQMDDEFRVSKYSLDSRGTQCSF